MSATVLVLGVAVATAVWVAGYRQWHPPVGAGSGRLTVGLAPATGFGSAYTQPPGEGYYSRPGWASMPVAILIGFGGLAVAVLLLQRRERPVGPAGEGAGRRDEAQVESR